MILKTWLMGRVESGLISRAFMLKIAAMKDSGSCASQQPCLFLLLNLQR